MKALGLLMIVFFCTNMMQSQEHRLALVIGNAKYQEKPLRNPENDAEDMSKTLKELGFEVIVKKNATLAEMQDSLYEFGKKVRKEKTIALFYYAGHGVQVDGKNYLLPIGLKKLGKKTLQRATLCLDEVIDTMEDTKSALNIVILDACRDNPFPDSEEDSGRSIVESQGLASVKSKGQMIVVYATEPGKEAKDGSGKNGTFTKHLLKNIRSTEDIALMMRKVREGVKKETQGYQIPWDSSSLTQGFQFLKKKKTVVSALRLMQTEYSKAKEKEAAFSIEEKCKLWEAFLQKHSKDIVSSQEDDMMREMASHKLHSYQNTQKQSKEKEKLEEAHILEKKRLEEEARRLSDERLRLQKLQEDRLEKERIQAQIQETSKSQQESIQLHRGSKKNNTAPTTPEPILEKRESLVYNLPQELWESCKYQNGEEWILDMTSERWCSLSVAEQKKYAKIYQEGYAKAKGLEIEKSISGIFMRLIPPGRFYRGSPQSEKGRADDEKRHRVTISKSFYIGKCEVTQGQWESVMGSNPCYFKRAGKNAPVEQVSWNDCLEFCQRTGMDLPTESQWEYACRAGVLASTYLGDGENQLSRIAWYDQNSGLSTHDVASKEENAWGMYDMLGNVWEWCKDWKADYTAEDAKDPVGALAGYYRVCRGGNWGSIPRLCRSANRYGFNSSYRNCYLGLRLCFNH